MKYLPSISGIYGVQTGSLQNFCCCIVDQVKLPHSSQSREAGKWWTFTCIWKYVAHRALLAHCACLLILQNSCTLFSPQCPTHLSAASASKREPSNQYTVSLNCRDEQVTLCGHCHLSALHSYLFIWDSEQDDLVLCCAVASSLLARSMFCFPMRLALSLPPQLYQWNGVPGGCLES